MPHRYFTTEISDGTATLRGADAHHLARVMRAKPGDTVILCDGNAVEYTATITGFGEDRVDFAVEPGYPSAAEPTVEVTLLAGYPKQDKLEQIIKHGVELGAAHIVPFFSRYCVAAPKKEEQKNERYNRIAVEAAKQCGRGVLPDVALPLPNFGAVCRSFAQYDLVLFCYECGGAPLRQLLADAKPADGQKLRLAIVTGAEGGFAAEEAEMAAKAGAGERFVIDSAATSTEELGNPVYPPARRELAAHSVVCGPHTARQMTRADYDKYDLLIGMDSANIRNMTRICGGDPAGKIHRLLDYTARPGDVADPWYTGDFSATWRDVAEGCRGLLKAIASQAM